MSGDPRAEAHHGLARALTRPPHAAAQEGSFYFIRRLFPLRSEVVTSVAQEESTSGSTYQPELRRSSKLSGRSGALGGPHAFTKQTTRLILIDFISRPTQRHTSATRPVSRAVNPALLHLRSPSSRSPSRRTRFRMEQWQMIHLLTDSTTHERNKACKSCPRSYTRLLSSTRLLLAGGEWSLERGAGVLSRLCPRSTTRWSAVAEAGAGSSRRSLRARRARGVRREHSRVAPCVRSAGTG